MQLGPVKLTGMYEVLGDDNGTDFATPLATLYKFQGWADLFLTTPGDGIKDANIRLFGKVGPVTLGAIYHDLCAEDSDAKLGTEFDVIAKWSITKRLTTEF